jgi:hypothetical protein
MEHLFFIVSTPLRRGENLEVLRPRNQVEARCAKINVLG